MNGPESKITSPFNPEEFRKEGRKLVDRLSDYLTDALSGRTCHDLLILLYFIFNHEVTLSFC